MPGHGLWLGCRYALVTLCSCSVNVSWGYPVVLTLLEHIAWSIQQGRILDCTENRRRGGLRSIYDLMKGFLLLRHECQAGLQATKYSQLITSHDWQPCHVELVIEDLTKRGSCRWNGLRMICCGTQ